MGICVEEPMHLCCMLEINIPFAYDDLIVFDEILAQQLAAYTFCDRFCTFHDEIWALHDIFKCHENIEIWGL